MDLFSVSVQATNRESTLRSRCLTEIKRKACEQEEDYCKLGLSMLTEPGKACPVRSAIERNGAVLMCGPQ